MSDFKTDFSRDGMTALCHLYYVVSSSRSAAFVPTCYLVKQHKSLGAKFESVWHFVWASPSPVQPTGPGLSTTPLWPYLCWTFLHAECHVEEKFPGEEWTWKNIRQPKCCNKDTRRTARPLTHTVPFIRRSRACQHLLPELAFKVEVGRLVIKLGVLVSAVSPKEKCAKVTEILGEECGLFTTLFCYILPVQ